MNRQRCPICLETLLALIGGQICQNRQCFACGNQIVFRDVSWSLYRTYTGLIATVHETHPMRPEIEAKGLLVLNILGLLK